MAFFDGFLNDHPPHPTPATSLLTASPISVQMKGVKVVDSWTKLHLHVTCTSGVLIFQQLSQQLKEAFEAASGWFFEHNPPNSGLICFKFSPVLKCNLMHQMIESFENIPNKQSKLGQKTDFLCNFQRFFNNALLLPSSCASILTPN